MAEFWTARAAGGGRVPRKRVGAPQGRSACRRRRACAAGDGRVPRACAAGDGRVRGGGGGPQGKSVCRGRWGACLAGGGRVPPAGSTRPGRDGTREPGLPRTTGPVRGADY